MGFYKNDSDEVVRVGEGQSRRVPPGAVVEGDFDDSPLTSVSDKDAEEYQKSQRGNSYGEGSRDIPRDKVFSDLRVYARTMQTGAPLNVVIGDDEAPYGPRTGTITTKQAVMRDARKNNSVERRQFGDNEWIGEDAEERNLGPVQESQANVSGALEASTDAALEMSGKNPADVKMSDVVNIEQAEKMSATSNAVRGPKDDDGAASSHPSENKPGAKSLDKK